MEDKAKDTLIKSIKRTANILTIKSKFFDNKNNFNKVAYEKFINEVKEYPLSGLYTNMFADRVVDLAKACQEFSIKNSIKFVNGESNIIPEIFDEACYIVMKKQIDKIIYKDVSYLIYFASHNACDLVNYIKASFSNSLKKISTKEEEQEKN